MENSIQAKILKIFKFVKYECEKNNLTYFAIGGTCIGAVRHKGFIPWDDDLDIALSVQDYNKLKEILKKKNSKYKLIDPLNDTSHCFFCKVHDINTTYIEASEVNDLSKYKGIWIDIMPICGIPKNKILKKIMILKIFYYKIMHNKNQFTLNQNGRTKKGKIIWILTYPIRKIHKKNYYALKYEKLISKFPISPKYDVLFPWRIPLRKPYKNVFNYNIFSGAKKLPFEDTTISCPIKYHEYLSQDFGDYMKLPPKEKQIVHHNNGCIIDLNKSYMEYKNQKNK